MIASDPDDSTLNFTWDFDDGTNAATTATNSVSHTFAVPGTYSVKVSYHVAHRQQGTIEAFDYSEKDGSMIDLVKVRVTLTP